MDAHAIREGLLALMAPLRTQLAAINERLDAINAERSELISARQEVVAVLKRLDPDALPNTNGKTPQVIGLARGNAERAKRQFDEKVEYIERELVAHGDRYADGFTPTSLAEALRDRIPRGASSSTVRRVLEVLRDKDLVRHDRKVKGGGMLYKITS